MTSAVRVEANVKFSRSYCQETVKLESPLTNELTSSELDTDHDTIISIHYPNVLNHNLSDVKGLTSQTSKYKTPPHKEVRS